MKIDNKELSCELVKAARGPLSQEQLNRKLGYRSNQIHRWEKGYTRISWREFCQLCFVMKIDLGKLFKSYFRFDGEFEEASEFFLFLFSDNKVSRMSKKVGISEGKLRRILKGETEINLDDFLKIIFSLDPMESVPFAHELVGKRKLVSLVKERKKIDSLIREYFSNPDLGLLLVCLNLPGYKKLSFHRDTWLAEVSGIAIKDVNRLLSLILETGLTQKENGKYILSPFRLSDRGQRSDMIKVRSFWTKKAMRKMGQHSERDAFGSLVFTTSNKAREKIISRYLRFFEELKQIVEEDTNPHEVPLVLNFHLFNPGNED